MTRRGSLAYYLAAWVVGGFVVAFAYWWQNGEAPSISQLLMVYFLALIVGLVDLLMFAFLLRRAMTWAGTHSIFVWAISGAALFFILLGVLTALSEKLAGGAQAGNPRLLANLVFSGPESLRSAGFWPAPAQGALIGAVLCLVDRPFEPLSGTPPPPPPALPPPPVANEPPEADSIPDVPQLPS